MRNAKCEVKGTHNLSFRISLSHYECYINIELSAIGICSVTQNAKTNSAVPFVQARVDKNQFASDKRSIANHFSCTYAQEMLAPGMEDTIHCNSLQYVPTHSIRQSISERFQIIVRDTKIVSLVLHSMIASIIIVMT
jgi:hypothetical protein